MSACILERLLIGAAVLAIVGTLVWAIVTGNNFDDDAHKGE